MDVGKAWLADDMMRGDAVDPRVERVELVARIDQRLIGEYLGTVPEADDPDLTDAADARTGCLDVDHDEIGRGLVKVMGQRLQRGRRQHGVTPSADLSGTRSPVTMRISEAGCPCCHGG
jgi:hypothetical protein